MIERDQIINNLDSLPSLPMAAIKAVKQLQDPEMSITKLTRTIEYDPALTTDVLHRANSAFFVAPRQIESVKQGIYSLGTNNIFRLVMARAVALCGDLMREELRLNVPNFIFTSALLHNIGKIVPGNDVHVEPQMIHNTAVPHNVSLDEVELALLGINHAEVGTLLLDNWNFQQNIIEVVRWHHYPENLPDEKGVIDLLHVSDNLCMKIGIEIGCDGLKHRSLMSLWPGARLARMKLSGCKFG